MARPGKKLEPRQVLLTVPKSRREAVTVAVAGTDAEWRVELEDVATFPHAKRVSRGHTFCLRPGMLRGIAAALVAIADATDSAATDLSPEELADDIDKAPEHLKAMCAVVGMGYATFLQAKPDQKAFRVFVPGASIVLFDDNSGVGPGAFDHHCTLIALRRASLFVLTVDGNTWAEQYHFAAGRALDGGHAVIIETTVAQMMPWLGFLSVEASDTTVLGPQEEASAEEVGRMH